MQASPAVLRILAQ